MGKGDNRIKILQVCHLYYPNIAGIEIHVGEISQRLAKRHDVTVFTTDPSGKLPKEEQINGVLVRRSRVFSPNNAYYFPLDMLKELGNSHFDIVHGHNYHAFPLFLSRRLKKTRFIVTPHYHRHGSTAFRDILIKLYRPFGKKIFHEADKVIALSDYEKRLLEEDFRINSDKIAVVPNGVNWDEFPNLGKKRSKGKTILYVARLEKFKGVQYAIKALPLLDESVRLEVVGKGPYKEKLVRLATGLGVTHRIDFYQDLYRSDLLKKYVNADLLMLLSKYEGFGITVAEALAAGTPCIVANTSGLMHWIENNSCLGIDYPINIERLAELIKKAMVRKVNEVKLWSWDEVAKQVETVYGELLRSDKNNC